LGTFFSSARLEQKIARNAFSGTLRVMDGLENGTLYAGTSGWTYATWKPDFYPAKLGSAKFLSHYASRLNTVEVNYTFRAFPTEKLLTKWVAEAPAGFKFAVKANQRITHIKRLREATQITTDFLNALRPLQDAGKLGPVLFQLPPYIKFDVALLQEFLSGLPRNFPCAFEFRHESWFVEDAFQLLREANVALCEAESEKLDTPQVQTADFAYLRLRKEEYSAAELAKLKTRIHSLLEKGNAFVYFKHEETPEGALNAERLLKAR
jgi:uncharacterized protein YecE (DUF72 family)